jgi:hypothetical protein
MSRGKSLEKGFATVGIAVAIAAAGVAAYIYAVRPWHRRWGATDEEVDQPLPGDNLVPDANFETTRAITIDAPPEAVWPWLVQIGQGRGGFYSYDFLENMAGLGIQSATEIRPELQNLQPGDIVPLEPEGGGYTVAALEPNSYLLLETQAQGNSSLDEVFRQAGGASTWLFYLEGQERSRTRLIVRWRARWNLSKSPVSLLIGLLLDPMEFIMEQRMLRGLKERAEAQVK